MSCAGDGVRYAVCGGIYVVSVPVALYEENAIGMSGYGIIAVESARTGVVWVVTASAHAE